MRRAFALVAIGAAFAAIVAIARSERVYSPGEVRAAFATAGSPVVPIAAFLPGCRPPRIRYWRGLTQPARPTIECVEAIYEVPGAPVSVYVFPSESFVTPFIAGRSELRYGFVAARSNVLVLGERRHSTVDVALDKLD